MGELKPCPLCDGQAKLCHGLPSTQNHGTYQAFVRCKKCGCKTKTFFQLPYESKADVDKAAKDSWNLRVAPKSNLLTCAGCKNFEEDNISDTCAECARFVHPDYYASKPEGSEKALATKTK